MTDEYEASGSQTAELKEAKIDDHAAQSALTASRSRSTREWLTTLRNGWAVRETVAIMKLSIPMVGLNCSQPRYLQSFSSIAYT